MPKDTRERTIDSRSSLRGGGGVFNGGGGGSGALPNHNILPGLTDGDAHTQYLNTARGNALYVPLARQIIAGAGLAGGGALSVDRSLALAESVAGAGLAFAAGVLSVNPGEGLEIEGDAIGLAATVAGAALAYSAGVLSVNPGEGLEIETDAIGLAASIAGDGLTYTAGVLAVGAGDGLTVTADAVALRTPGTLSVATANVAANDHTHAVTSSADPDASASLLATTAAGLLSLRNLAMRQAAQSYATFASGFAGSGWRVDYGITTANRASAEFDDLTVRGRMRVYELLIQQIRATNGSLFVTSGSKTVAVTADANTWTVNGVPLMLNNAPAVFNANFYTINTAAAGDTSRSLYHGFLYGDNIVAQQVMWDGTQFAGVMQSKLEVTRVDSLTQYGAALVEGDAPAAGYDYVRRGSTVDSSRRGAIYLTSDDSNAPFIDIIDGLQYHSDWGSADVKRVRLGRLSGISDVDFGGPLDGYGLYANRAYIKGKVVVTGGSLGGLAAADVNQNTTTIDGGRITANSITAAQIAANTITTTQLNFTPVLTGNVVASINATAEGLKIAASLIQIDGTTTFSAGYNPATKVASGDAAADINANTTTIDGGKITALSITAAQIAAGAITALKINVGTLSAITANLGAVTAGSIVTGSTNKLWLNDGGDGGLAIGGAVKASAPTQISAAGELKSIKAAFGTLSVDTTGAFVTPPSTFNLDYGYKFRYGATNAAGLIGRYSAGSRADLYLLNNMATTDNSIVDSNADSYLIIAGAAGSTKTSQVSLIAKRVVGGVDNLASLTITNTSAAQTLSFQGNTIWHAGNDGPGSLLNADLVDGKEAADFALLGANNTFSYVTTFVGAAQFDSFTRLTPLASAPAYQNGYGLIYLLDAGSNSYQLRARIRSADAAKQIDYQITLHRGHT